VVCDGAPELGTKAFGFFCELGDACVAELTRLRRGRDLSCRNPRASGWPGLWNEWCVPMVEMRL
jgi:hypothetical protein